MFFYIFAYIKFILYAEMIFFTSSIYQIVFLFNIDAHIIAVCIFISSETYERTISGMVIASFLFKYIFALFSLWYCLHSAYMWYQWFLIDVEKNVIDIGLYFCITYDSCQATKTLQLMRCSILSFRQGHIN